MSTHRPFLAIAAAALLVLGAVGCSSSDDDTATTTTEAAGDSSTTAPSDDASSGTEDEESSAPAGQEDCEADRDAGIEQQTLSGVSSVLFAADVDSGVSEADITEATTLTLAEDGSSFSPATLNIGVGEVFGVASPQGAGLAGITVGCAGGQTLSGGMTVGFVITEAGTYEVADELNPDVVATVIAE